MQAFLKSTVGSLVALGDAIWFLRDVMSCIFRGKIRVKEVLKQVYEQGIQSITIVAITSLASGLVLGLQGYVILVRFGAKEYIAQLVALSLVRELSPVFTALIFSGKAGARITAEVGTMNVNDQILATRTMGVDPIEFLIVPRILACFIVMPILGIVSEFLGIFGGYLVGVLQANIDSSTYINQTLRSLGYVDFFSGLVKIVFFGFLVGWVCCYQGFNTRGGSFGVGQHTTKAVAFSYIFVILSNVLLTKVILTFWG